MFGINRATKEYKEEYKEEYNKFSESLRNEILRKSCVFLSHQQKDKCVCKEIANYLMAEDIDVYFDEYDEDLKISCQKNSPQEVVECICKGIKKSSHMLVVISPCTIDSKWVPWEVGYGYKNTDLSILTLKGIKDEDLPDYLKTAKRIIRGTKSLHTYLEGITGKKKQEMESINFIESDSKSNHPLDDYLDWNK